MTIGIYKITNTTNGKYYLGSSTNIEGRFSGHKYHLRLNKHHNKHLQSAWNKYLEVNFAFEIIDTITKDKAEKVFSLEQSYLDAIADWTSVYNVSNNTEHPTLGLKHEGSKYYSWDKDKKCFIVAYRVDGIQLKFGKFEKEEDAQEQVKYIKSLSKLELKQYHTEVRELDKKSREVFNTPRKRSFKGYHFDKSKNAWRVRIWSGFKSINFGYHKTEKEAIDKLAHVKINYPKLFVVTTI